jgi:hypothetical protein
LPGGRWVGGSQPAARYEFLARAPRHLWSADSAFGQRTCSHRRQVHHDLWTSGAVSRVSVFHDQHH